MTEADPAGERRSPDRTNPAEAAFKAAILKRIGALADQPARLERFLNGLAADGTLKRLELPAGLAPMMRLPAPETETSVRARMALFIQDCLGGNGTCTREELGLAFTDDQIVRHARAAGRIAGVAAMAC